MTTTMKPTVHNPTNFQPTDYTILGYFDNQPPQPPMFADWSDPSVAEAFKAEREAWQQERQELFPKNNCYKCQHCGQGRVRYVVSAKHHQTGEHVCFGCDCVARLDFPDHQAFRAEKIRSKAADMLKRAKLEAKQKEFLKDRPELEARLKALFQRDPIHEKNAFAHSVSSNFWQYGHLSDKQIDCIMTSTDRDIQRAAEKAAEPKPELPVATGRRTVVGEILATKLVESDYGDTLKMLVREDDHNKVWGTVPSGLYDLVPVKEGEHQFRGTRVSFTATVEASRDDEHFGFYSRPTKPSLPLL